jgi:hypothetical protein
MGLKFLCLEEEKIPQGKGTLKNSVIKNLKILTLIYRPYRGGRVSPGRVSGIFFSSSGKDGPGL